MMAPRRAAAAIACAGALLLPGCGGDAETAADPARAVPAEQRDRVRAAQEVDAAAFPQPDGRSLDEIAAELETGGPQVGLATSVFRTGDSRLAFGVIDSELKFVYGQTVVYLQPPGGGDVIGPVAAPADVLLTEARYRSKQAATESDPFAAVYEALVELPEPGLWRALVASEIEPGRRIGATFDFEVVPPREDPIPDVGEPAPRVATDTIASLKGDVELADTRIPPAEELHETSFDEVVGQRPVALLFATPQLCQSRVCGPVVDEALQLKSRYGDRMEFIHQEVFEGNDPGKGLREPLERFNLQTEPWLFTVRADGTIAARLEGSFGLRAFERAIRAAL